MAIDVAQITYWFFIMRNIDNRTIFWYFIEWLESHNWIILKSSMNTKLNRTSRNNRFIENMVFASA